jgi:hypothetical protein
VKLVRIDVLPRFLDIIVLDGGHFEIDFGFESEEVLALGHVLLLLLLENGASLVAGGILLREGLTTVNESEWGRGRMVLSICSSCEECLVRCSSSCSVE